MNALATFNYGSKAVRIVDIDGAPWFIAKDICDCLDLENVSRATENLDEDDKGMTTAHTPGGKQSLLIISEPGMYELTLNDNKNKFTVKLPWKLRDLVRLTNELALDTGSGNSKREKIISLLYKVQMFTIELSRLNLLEDAVDQIDTTKLADAQVRAISYMNYL